MLLGMTIVRGPKGMGVYARNVSNSAAKAKAFAKKASDHKLKFVALMGPWQDPGPGGRLRTRVANNTDTLARWSDALLDRGIDPLLWFYPWAGVVDELVEILDRLLARVEITGLMPDPELGMKWKGRRARGGPLTMRGQPEALKGVAARGSEDFVRSEALKLMLALGKLVKAHPALENFGVGVTSYGILRYHKTLAVQELLRTVPVWLSPQLYTATPAQVDDAIDDWRERAGDFSLDVVPSFGLYGPNSGPKLLAHLSSFVDGTEDVDGLIGWSAPQASAFEWDVMALFADWLDRGVCSLGPGDKATLTRIVRRLAA